MHCNKFYPYSINSKLNSVYKLEKKPTSSTQEHVCPVIQGLAMQDTKVPESVSLLLLQLFGFGRLTHCVNQFGAVSYQDALLLGLVWYDKPLTFPLLCT